MRGAGSIAFPVVAVIAWVLVGVKFGHARRDRGNPSQLALLAVFVFLALTFTTCSPGVWGLIDSYSLYGDLANLYAQTFVICAMASLVALLILWSYPLARAKPRIYVRLGLIALAVAAMITLFVSVDRMHAKDVSRLVSWYAGSAGFIAYLLVYQAVFSFTMLDIVLLCSRYARMVKTTVVRRGLLVTAVGAGFGLLYSAVRLTDIAASANGISLDALEPVAALAAAIGATLVMTGLTLPSWAARYRITRAYLSQRRAYRQMEPLWTALIHAMPWIVLNEPTRPTSRRGFDFKLRRRVIEIHDGVLALRPYRDPAVAERARRWCDERGLTGIARAAQIEAACLHGALLAQAGNDRHGGSPPDNTFAGSSLDDELRWLTQLSKAFAQHQACEGVPTWPSQTSTSPAP